MSPDSADAPKLMDDKKYIYKKLVILCVCILTTYIYNVATFLACS